MGLSMRRRLPYFLVLFFLPLAAPSGLIAEPPSPPISGVVRHLQKPVADALIAGPTS